jgi:hypothetical protein
MKKDQKKSKEEGYIPFDPEELKNITQEGDPNDEAYELLWEATCVSSHVSETSKASGHADDDDIYPTSAQETDKMEELVNQAVAALKEPNPEFNEKVSALRDIIGWSRKRHWKLNWRIIVGVIIFIFILNHCASSKKADVNDVAEKLEIVKNWNEDNITIPLEKFEGAGWRILEKYYADAKTWKSYKLSFIAHDYYTAQKDIEYFKAELEKDKSEGVRKYDVEGLEKSTKKFKDKAEEYKELNEADFEEFQEMAIEEFEGKLDEKESDANWVKFWNIFFILLIPVYIFAARPFGYLISRYRKEANTMSKIEKIGLWLSGGLFAAGAGIGFVDIVTKWSDGSTSRSDDGTGPVRLAIKLGLFAAAVLVFCAVSCFLMLYATITGLKRNYDWGAVKAKAVEASEASKTKK